MEKMLRTEHIVTEFNDTDMKTFEFSYHSDYYETESDKENKTPYKIFISLPFTIKEDTLRERFINGIEFINKSVRTKLKDKTIIIAAQININYLMLDKKSVPDSQYPYYMGKDIQSILECDAILMCDGWQKSKGCNLEYQAATIFNKDIIFEIIDKDE